MSASDSIRSNDDTVSLNSCHTADSANTKTFSASQTAGGSSNVHSLAPTPSNVSVTSATSHSVKHGSDSSSGQKLVQQASVPTTSPAATPVPATSAAAASVSAPSSTPTTQKNPLGRPSLPGASSMKRGFSHSNDNSSNSGLSDSKAASSEILSSAQTPATPHLVRRPIRSSTMGYFSHTGHGMESIGISPTNDDFNDFLNPLPASSQAFLPRTLVNRTTEGFSPRLSFSMSHKSDDVTGLAPVLKDDYRGFHRNMGNHSNVPPLSQPIKPRFREKGSLLGKLIHSNRKDSESLVNSNDSLDTTLPPRRTGSSTNTSSKHKFRLPSISLHHHTTIMRDSSRNPSLLEESSDRNSTNLSGYSSKTNSVSGPAGSPPKEFNLELNLKICKLYLNNQPPAPEDQHKHSAWKAPDSWDVTEVTPFVTEGANASDLSESDTEKDSEKNDLFPSNGYSSSGESEKSKLVLAETANTGSEKLKQKKKSEDIPTFLDRGLPILYGSVASKTSLPEESKLTKGPNHIIRVFKEDNTFTTILCPLQTTTAELLKIIQRKFFLDSISNYEIAMYIGKNVKILEPFEKPLKIQQGLLTLSGYTAQDNLRTMGREDMSSICKCLVESISLRNLTYEEEATISKDYVEVNISSYNLKTIPIVFHQHTFEIEKLDVSDNPAIYIPLDFIQSCTNLSTIVFSRNGCSRFPLNFLHATNLKRLLMDANFLDEIPTRIGLLKNLEHLKMNSNQLYYLHNTFAKLSNLVTLNLSSNYFRNFPECITHLSNLQDLDLSYNDLTSIPNSIGRLTKLTKLNLSTNKLTLSLPNSLKKLTNLKRLDIRYNRITNIDVLGSLANLEVVYASKNSISRFNDKMESLKLLHFDRNPITSLEFEILLPRLTVLDLSMAKITAVPPEFITKIPHIEKMVLDKNHLVSLPDELGGLPKLRHLSLFDNNIHTLPSTIGKLSSLQYLDLHSNNVESLPEEIWFLRSLNVLNISSNILSTFPKPPLEVAKKMSDCAAHREQFDNAGSIRVKCHVISIADSLTSLSIADNRLQFESFESLALMSNLTYLNLSYNDFSEIPEGAFSRLTKLTELFLSGNGLTKLPAEDLERLVNLRTLFLNNNKLTSLPPELSKCQNLTHFDVGSNLLRYNISNWPYDWNWSYNPKLKYLNFSGNKRFEIKQSYTQNPETNESYDSLLVLKDLKVLGLMDVTLTTPSVPDLSCNLRVRTTSSELNNVGYGVCDSMGSAETVSFRDLFLQNFRGNDNEVLIYSFDGVGNTHQSHGHLISYICKQMFAKKFALELDSVKSNDEIPDAMRRTFLNLNKEINSVLAAKKSGFFTSSTVSPDLGSLTLAEDAKKGCCLAVVYLKDGIVYTANVGDIEIVLSKSNTDYKLLSTKHDPTLRVEFERIRASGGHVSTDGALDGTLQVSRGIGFFNYVPHTNAGPSTSIYDPAGSDAVIIIATATLWAYVSYDLAVDIVRQERDDPMVAAEKLRDHALCYGATEKISVAIVSLGEQKRKRDDLSYSYNLGREIDLLSGSKKKDRAAPTGDTSLRRLNDEIDPPVGNLALVFTDIKNSTLLWDAYPVAMRSAIKLHNTLMRRQLRIVGGYEVKTEGDSFMVSFPTSTSALLWCFTIQKQLLTEDWPAEILQTNECCEVTDNSGNIISRGLSVRMGIHWGSPVCELDMVTRRMDYFGPMVNRASRIESSADGGQIAVSSDFMKEMERTYAIHKKIDEKETTLEEAYVDNVVQGEIVEKEIKSLKETGCVYYQLGERKLKGLETPEMITLAYPETLAMRYEIFERQSETMESRVCGAFPVESIFQLRGLSLRLENICSILNAGYNTNEDVFNRVTTDLFQKNLTTGFQEKDIVCLFNHLVTRIEGSIATLELRQAIQQANGNEGRINFTGTEPLWNVIDEIKRMLLGHSS